MLGVALICYIPYAVLSPVCAVLFLTIRLLPKAPPHPCTSLACLLSSCRPSCIRSPSRLQQWPLQHQLATTDISQAFLPQTLRMEKHQQFLHLHKPELSSPDLPLPHGFLSLPAPGQLPSTCVHQGHQQPASSLHRWGVVANIIFKSLFDLSFDWYILLFLIVIGCCKLSQCFY